MKYVNPSHPLVFGIIVLFSVTQKVAYCGLEEEDEAEDVVDIPGGNQKWTENTDEGDIEIEIFKQGEDCEKKAANGDILVVNYQAIMPVSGVEFDNRWVPICKDQKDTKLNSEKKHDEEGHCNIIFHFLPIWY